jgi:hypothetical protein
MLTFRRNLSPLSSVCRVLLDGFLRGLLFDREDGGRIFFRNVGFPLNCTIFQHETVFFEVTAVGTQN